MRIRAISTTHTGRVRKSNEDCLLLGCWIAQASGSLLDVTYDPAQRSILLAVLDGMGGHAGGAIASSTAALALSTVDLGDIGAALENVSQAVTGHGRMMPGYSDMGATIAGVLFTGDQVTLFNVGDTRIYRFVDGYLGQVSVDDLVPDRTGVGKGFVTQSLGGRGDAVLDAHTMHMPLEPGLTLLVCSDGLYDCVSHDDIAALLELGGHDAVHALLDAALNAGAPDNVSVLTAAVESDTL